MYISVHVSKRFQRRLGSLPSALFGKPSKSRHSSRSLARYIKLTAELKGQKERALVTHDFQSKQAKECAETVAKKPISIYTVVTSNGGIFGNLFEL